MSISPGLLAMACKRVKAVWEAEDPGPNDNPDNKELLVGPNGFATGHPNLYIPNIKRSKNMEDIKNIFQDILKESLEGKYEEIFTQDKAGDLIQKIIDLGKEKTTLSNICDGNILASLIATILIGNLLTSLQMPEEVVPAGIGMFMNTYPNDLYFIIGCLALAAERGLNFEGKELVEVSAENKE